MKQRIPRVMIAATGSGSGKTMVSCGLLKCFQQAGKAVAAFKCGPDYIDPMFHEQVLKVPSRNLDPWFTDEHVTRQLFLKDAAAADISIVEGVMGYYDGAGGVSTQGSSFELACTLGTPVILVVDVTGMSLSVCGVIKGFMELYQPSLICGVILNRISPGMYPLLKEQIEKICQVKVCGYLPRMDEAHFESRHLGLMTPENISGIEEKLTRIRQQCEASLDLQLIWKLAASASPMEARSLQMTPVVKGTKIAVARDEAFCFYYKDNLELLTELGAELVYVSPMRDREIPGECSGVLFGGGYPESYAAELEANHSMRSSVKHLLSKGMPCIAECGGFLYLHRTLYNQAQKSFDMVGVVDGECSFAGRSARFGYITLRAEQGLESDELWCRGHEFHYMESTNPGVDLQARKPVTRREWPCGHLKEGFYAGFPHLYFYSNPDIARRFLQKAAAFKERA